MSDDGAELPETDGSTLDVNSTLCDTFFDPEITQYIASEGCRVIASLLLLIMVILQKKKKRGKCCCKCWCGIVVPVKFLEDKQNRASIIAVFTLVSKEVYYLLFTLNIDKIAKEEKLDPWAKLLSKLGLIEVMSCTYLPILAACSNNSSIFIQFLGIIYICVDLFSSVLQTFPWCEHREDLFQAVLDDQTTILYFTISALVFLVLTYGFFKKIIQISHQRVYQINPELNHDDFHSTYVKNLLNSSKRLRFDETSLDEKESCSSKYIYSNTKGFRFSVTLLIGVYVGLVAVIMLATNYYKYVISSYNFVLTKIEFLHNIGDGEKPYYDAAVQAVKFVLGLPSFLLFKSEDNRFEKFLEKNITAYDIAYQQVHVVFGSLFSGITLSLVILFISFLNMLTHYKHNVLELSKQVNLGHLLNVKSISNTNIIVNATQFGGYQAAHFIWGFHIQAIVLCLVLIIFCELVVVPLLIDFEDFFYVLAQFVGPLLAVFVLTMLIQYLLVRFLFVQDGGKVLALDNKRCFYQMMYLMFFFNLLSGVITCLLRILKSLIFSILVLPRLDRTAFPHMFSRFDSGFKAYACLLRLEAIQSNSILIVFSRICKLSKQRKLDYSAMAKNIIRPRKVWCKRQCRARNRWFLAWTLIYNGHLVRSDRKVKEVRGPLATRLLK